jgi:hypothetical protein
VSLGSREFKKAVLAAHDEFDENQKLFEHITEGLQEKIRKPAMLLQQYFENRGFVLPKSIDVHFSAYGTQGSYDLPNVINIRLDVPATKVIEIIIHELIHLAIEGPVVDKFSLSQQEKESLVDWVMTKTVLGELTPNYRVQDWYEIPRDKVLNIFNILPWGVE